MSSPEAARTDEASRPALPMVLVPRGAAQLPQAAPGPIWRVFKVARFVPLIMALVMTGGVIGLYFQPPGLKFVFATFGLQPGGGTTTPSPFRPRARRRPRPPRRAWWSGSASSCPRAMSSPSRRPSARAMRAWRGLR